MASRPGGTHTPPPKRTPAALKRRDETIRRYVKQGMTDEEATTKAVEEVVSDPHKDGRHQ
jgi:hypothetical protein